MRHIPIPLAFIASAFICTSPTTLNAQTPIVLSPQKTNVFKGETFDVRWTTGSAPTAGDWVSIYTSSPPTLVTGELSIAYVKADILARQTTFSLMSTGRYEIRYEQERVAGGVTAYEMLAKADIFVMAQAPGEIVISAKHTEASVREPVAAQWWTGTNVSSTADWVSLYPTGHPTTVTGDVAIAFVRVRKTFSAPIDRTQFYVTAPGSYEFRYERAVGEISGSPVYEMLARSETVMVKEAASDPGSIRNFPSPGQNIIVLGDSLTAGVGATEGEDLVSELSRRLCCLPIINAGITGDTTADALARLSTDVLAKSPKIVVVVLGGNDFLQRIPAAATYQNLKEIIVRIQGAGAIVVLVGVQGGKFTDGFAGAYAALARETGSAYVPNVLLGILGKAPLLSDAVHPNDWGYSIMAKRIAPAVAALNASAPAALAFAPASVSSSGPVLGLSWKLPAGSTYVLNESFDLSGGWSPILKLFGENDIVCEIIPRAKNAFYTIRAEGSGPDAALMKRAMTEEEIDSLTDDPPAAATAPEDRPEE